MNPHPAIQKIYELFPISASALSALTEKFIPHVYVKNQVLLNTGQIPSSIFFIEKGCVRCYHLDQGNQVTTQFVFSNDFFIPTGFFSLHKSIEYVEILDESILHTLDKSDITGLAMIFPEVELLLRNLLELNHLQCQKRNNLLRIISAQNRYRQFIQQNQEILHLITQEMLASYLNISRKHLSRIRNHEAFRK